MTSQHVTYAEIASDWGVSVATVQRWMSEDHPPRLRRGRHTVLTLPSYRDWCLRRHGTAPPPRPARTEMPADLAKLRAEAHELIGLAATMTARANDLLASLPGPET